ncbi:MAG: hypothetical protein ACREYE_07890 [Gammaproteobacteria bacterium]
MSPAGQQHGRIAATITASLGQHVTEHKLGAVYARKQGFYWPLIPIMSARQM